MHLDQYLSLVYNRNRMNNLPQQVTSRYVSNLMSVGQNNEFRICSLTSHNFCIQETECGCYFKVAITQLPGRTNLWEDVGPTAHDAVRNALAKAGVTFR